MTHPITDTRRRDQHLERTLDHVRRLSEQRPGQRQTPEWWAQAAQVGDLTALAALTLARSPRG
jgi:hypothetical protein